MFIRNVGNHVSYVTTSHSSRYSFPCRQDEGPEGYLSCWLALYVCVQQWDVSNSLEGQWNVSSSLEGKWDVSSSLEGKWDVSSSLEGKWVSIGI